MTPTKEPRQKSTYLKREVVQTNRASSHHCFTGVTVINQGSPLWYLDRVIAPFMVSGVDLFFVLSGFLIGGILIDHRGASPYFSTFYIRRVCRIFPVYFLLLGSFVLILASGLPQRYPSQLHWLFADGLPLWSYATFTQNFGMAATGASGAKWLGITWSLAVEEQFYLLFPLIVFATPRRHLATVVVCALAVAPICRHIVTQQYNGFAAYVLLPCRMDTLMSGVLAALAVRNERVIDLIRSFSGTLYAGLALLAGLLMLNSFGLMPMGTLRYSLLAWLYAGVLVVAVVHSGSMIGRFLKTRFLAFTGLISYAIYMFHEAINGLVHGFSFNSAPAVHNGITFAVTLISIMLTFLAAYCSQIFLERPIRRWGKRFAFGPAPAPGHPRHALREIG